MTRLILLFFVLTFFTSCDFLGTPAGIIPKDKMILLLADMQVTDSYVTTMTADSLKRHKIDFYQSVFKKHHTDSAQFSKSLEYYARDPQKLQAMYETIQPMLDTLINNVAERERVEREKEKHKK